MFRFHALLFVLLSSFASAFAQVRNPADLTGGGTPVDSALPYRETEQRQVFVFDGIAKVVFPAGRFPALRAPEGFTAFSMFRVPPSVTAGTLFASGNWRIYQKNVRASARKTSFLVCEIGKKTVFSRRNPFSDNQWHALSVSFQNGILNAFLDGKSLFHASGAVMSDVFCVGAKPLASGKFSFPLYDALGTDLKLLPGVLPPERHMESFRLSAAELPPAKPPYRKLEITHGPYLLNPDHSSISICCVTGAPCRLTLRFRLKGETSFESAEDRRDGVIRKNVRNHIFHLSNLLPGKEYEYYFESQTLPHLFYRGLRHVTARHPDGTLDYNVFLGCPVFGRESLYRFTVPDRASEKLSMLVLPDLHNDGALMMNMIRIAGPLDFYLLNGDAVSCISDVELDFFPQLYDFFVREFHGGKTLQPLRGNHEWTGRAASSFRDFFPPPREKLYYALRLGPVLCICLDTGMTNHTGAYYTEQAEWLRALTKTEVYRDSPFRVIFTHCGTHGLAAFTPDYPEAVGKVLNSLTPDLLPHLMVGGHIHADMRLNAGEDNTRVEPFRRGAAATGKSFRYHAVTIFGALKLEFDLERLTGTLYRRGTDCVIDRFEIRRDRSIRDLMQVPVFPAGLSK